jgi:hypothetical protein
MSDLDRILKLAGQAHQSPAPAVEVATTEREMKPVAQEAVGEFADPILDLCDDLGCDSDHPVLDELIRYLDGDTIKDFVADFRRHNDMNHPGEDGDYGDDDQNFGEAEIEEAKGVCKDCGCEIDNCKPGCDCPHDSHDASGDHWVAEAKAKPDFLDVDKDGDKDEPMKKAIKDKKVDEAEEADTDTEELEEAQSQAQKDAFAKMLASKKGAKKDDEADKVEETEELEEVAVAEDDKEELEESPTMDTTQLVNLMKNSGLSEEAIESKLNEWANTPEGAAEEESTVYAEPYELAQSVNLSLKRYLDAESMKVGIKEHTVEDLKEAYKAKKSK